MRCFQSPTPQANQTTYTQPAGEPCWRRAASRLPGFTIVEILVVITIIGILAAAVAINVTGYVGKSRRERAKMDISRLESAVELYYMQYGSYPSSQQGLQALTQSSQSHPNGIISSMPTDPWGNAYVYRYPGQYGRFDIVCYGADGAPGGKGENADIGNWQLDQNNQQQPAAPARTP